MTAPGQRSKHSDCHCPPGCAYCAEAGECKCPEGHAPYSSLEDKPAKPHNPTEAFKRFCEENEGALECRIYED